MTKILFINFFFFKKKKNKGVYFNFFFFFFGKSLHTPLKQPLNLQYPLNYQKIVNVPFKASKKWQKFSSNWVVWNPTNKPLKSYTCSLNIWKTHIIKKNKNVTPSISHSQLHIPSRVINHHFGAKSNFQYHARFEVCIYIIFLLKKNLFFTYVFFFLLFF